MPPVLTATRPQRVALYGFRDGKPPLVPLSAREIIVPTMSEVEADAKIQATLAREIEATRDMKGRRPEIQDAVLYETSFYVNDFKSVTKRKPVRAAPWRDETAVVRAEDPKQAMVLSRTTRAWREADGDERSDRDLFCEAAGLSLLFATIGDVEDALKFWAKQSETTVSAARFRARPPFEDVVPNVKPKAPRPGASPRPRTPRAPARETVLKKSEKIALRFSDERGNIVGDTFILELKSNPPDLTGTAADEPQWSSLVTRLLDQNVVKAAPFSVMYQFHRTVAGRVTVPIPGAYGKVIFPKGKEPKRWPEPPASDLNLVKSGRMPKRVIIEAFAPRDDRRRAVKIQEYSTILPGNTDVRVWLRDGYLAERQTADMDELRVVDPELGFKTIYKGRVLDIVRRTDRELADWLRTKTDAIKRPSLSSTRMVTSPEDFGAFAEPGEVGDITYVANVDAYYVLTEATLPVDGVNVLSCPGDPTRRWVRMESGAAAAPSPQARNVAMATMPELLQGPAPIRRFLLDEED